MKRATGYILAGCAALLALAGPAAGADAEAAGQPEKKEARQDDERQLSAEEREIIEHMEMLKNLKLYKKEDMEMLLTLDVLTANE